MDYLEWNDLIARHFFNEEMAGREVLLYVNEDLIKKLGEPFNAEAQDFIEAVKRGPAWVTRSGFCQKAFQAFRSWRDEQFNYPPYIGYLAFFVMARGTEADVSENAYYPRFWKLLGESIDQGTPPSFHRMLSLWDDLEKWSREDKHESLGRFVARIRGSDWKVGLPLSQTILSEEERRLLPSLFNDAGLDPTDTPSPETILRILLSHGQHFFEKRTMRFLRSNKQEDVVLKEALVSLILDELNDWDGTVYEIVDQQEVTSRVQTGLRICLYLDGVAQTVKCSLRFKTGKVFPEDGLNFEQAGNVNIWSCTESHQGWSKELKDRQLTPPLTLDAAKLDWTEGLQIVDKENHWRARLKGSTVKLFLLGEDQVLSGWIESQRLERGEKFLIACYNSEEERIKKWGNECCERFGQKVVNGLPSGWMMFEGSKARQSCPGVDVLFISSTIRLLIRGGIKVGNGNTYLKSYPPQIILENSSGNEMVTMNGIELKRNNPDVPVWNLPEDAPVNEILQIEIKIGDYKLRRILRLQEPALPEAFDQVPFRDRSGKILRDSDNATIKACGITVDLSQDGKKLPAYPQTLPIYLSEKIVFVGQYPGQIAEWPPVAWRPVWAIAKKGNKDWEVHFCGTAEQIQAGHCKDERFGSAVDRKKWKEALWINRKVTKQPQFAQLRALWAEYVKVAQNV
jgi:hypothetical protein